jgi:hypothetical protein
MGSSSSTVATVILAPGGVRLQHHKLCEATLRYSGHILDLVLTRRDEHLLANRFVSDQLTDQSVVYYVVKGNRPVCDQ